MTLRLSNHFAVYIIFCIYSRAFGRGFLIFKMRLFIFKLSA